MMRTMAFALAAMAAICLGSTSSVSAMGKGSGGSGHVALGHASGIGPSATYHYSNGPSHHFASHHHHHHHHHLVFVGAPFGYDYGYDYDACYERVWTKSGWKLVSQCY
jgi:hypothetical protein